MKKYFITLLAVVFIIFYPPGIARAQDNLIPNGGFEYGDSLWDLYAGGGSEVNYEISAINPAEGNYCLKTEVIQLGSNYWDVQFQNVNWGAVLNQAYRYSFKAKSEPAGRRLNCIVLKATSPYTYYADNRNITITSEWKTYSYTFSSPVTTEDDIMITFHLTYSNTTYWVDDVRLFEEIIGSATVRREGTKIWITFIQEMQDPSQEPQITFIVTVNSSKTIKVTSQSLLPDDPRIVELELEDTIYRYQDVNITYYPGTLATETGSEIGEFTIDATNNSRIITSSEELTVDLIKIYPNPVEDRLIIDNLNISDWSSACIIDITGREIKRIDIKNNTFDVHDIKSGLYFLQLQKADGNTCVCKFIKK